MKTTQYELSRRGFFGKLCQWAVAMCGVKLHACSTASKMDLTPRPLFLPPDPKELSVGEEEIISSIRRSLPFLNLDPEGLAAFARDFVLYRDSGALQFVPYLDLPRRFLLSSDFFANDADESELVRYVVFSDPFATPCSNQLALPPSS